MINIKRFIDFVNEDFFWNKKSEEKPSEEVKIEGELDIEEKPYVGGGKLIEVDQEFWKDWAQIIPKYEQFEQVTFLADENSTITIYKPDIKFMAKDPNHPNFSVQGEENVSIRYDKKDNPHLDDSVLKQMESDNIIIRRHFMSLIKPEFIGMHCGNMNSVVVKD